MAFNFQSREYGAIWNYIFFVVPKFVERRIYYYVILTILATIAFGLSGIKVSRFGSMLEWNM